MWLGGEERLMIGQSLEVVYVDARGVSTALLPIERKLERSSVLQLVGSYVLENTPSINDKY